VWKKVASVTFISLLILSLWNEESNLLLNSSSALKLNGICNSAQHRATAVFSCGAFNMDIVQTIAIGAGMAWASGMRLYAVMFCAGLLSHFGFATLPGELGVLAHPWVLVASGFMFGVEFLADKVPGLDSLWDAIHTFIRIPAGAIMAAAALGNMNDPAVMMVAGILGGTLASSSHFAKAGSRALINTSPEPFSNWAASFSEEAMVGAGLYLAFMHPMVFLAALAIIVLLSLWLIIRLWRFMAGLFRKLTLKGPTLEPSMKQLT
jgi:hypothetical protein